MIGVAQEEVYRVDALTQAAIDLVPFLFADNAGKNVIRKDSFDCRIFAVDSEGDTAVQKGQVCGLLALGKFIGL